MFALQNVEAYATLGKTFVLPAIPFSDESLVRPVLKTEQR